MCHYVKILWIAHPSYSDLHTMPLTPWMPHWSHISLSHLQPQTLCMMDSSTWQIGRSNYVQYYFHLSSNNITFLKILFHFSLIYLNCIVRCQVLVVHVDTFTMFLYSIVFIASYLVLCSIFITYIFFLSLVKVFYLNIINFNTTRTIVNKLLL